jgi:hypothetical protein
MSSLAFSFDDLDSLLNSTSLVASSSLSMVGNRPPSLLASSSSMSSSASPHGESPAFADVAASLLGGVSGGGGAGGGATGGGGDEFSGEESGGLGRGGSGGTGKPSVNRGTPAKRVGLILDPSPIALCLGLMTSAKFCTRILAEGATSCGTAAHARKFQPPPSSAFLKDTEVRALCSPALDLTILSPAQRLRIQGVQLTASEWGQLFQQVQQRKPPKWLAFEESPVATIDTLAALTALEILSPTNVESGGLLAVIPMLSFDESIAPGEEITPEMNLADVITFIYKFHSQFSSLKTKWARAFTEVEAGYGLVVQDLQRLQSIFQEQSAIVGSPVALDGKTPPTVWDGLHVIHETVSSVASAVQAQANSIDALAVDQTNLTHSVLALESQADASTSLSDEVSRLTVDLRALENRVLRLVPLLNQLRRGQPPPFNPAPDTDAHLVLAAKVENCEQLIKAF